MKTVLLGLTLLIFQLQAASFLPIDIHERMKNSDLAIRGLYQGGSYKKLPSGQVVTEHSFSISKTAGVAGNDIVNKNSFKVITPGGIWNGLHYKVSGTPKFEIGEDVVLMLSKGKYGHVFPDLAMSKFTVENKRGIETLVSDIFPEKENIGRISYDDFRQLSQDFYGEDLKKFEADKFVYGKKVKTVKGRAVASKISEDSGISEDGKKFSFFWLTIILAFLGAYWTRQSTKKSE